MKPTKFVQFYVILGDAKPREILGSDGVAYLDGRYGLTRCEDEARSIAIGRRALKQIDAFQIRHGKHTEYRALTPIKLMD